MDKETPDEEKIEAEKVASLVVGVMPHGTDPTTFMKCLLDSGCGKMVCPICCGRCPTSICQDLQCIVSSSIFYVPYISIYGTG
jgi:hypothetical protein